MTLVLKNSIFSVCGSRLWSSIYFAIRLMCASTIQIKLELSSEKCVPAMLKRSLVCFDNRTECVKEHFQK